MARRKTPFLCTKCGAPDRESHAGLCLSCYNKDYYQKHKEEIIQKSAEWIKNNRERSNEIQRNAARRRYAKLSREEKLSQNRKTEAARGEEEKSRRRAKAREWYKKNRDKVRNKPTYKAPCSDCGKSDPKARYVAGRCKSCYGKRRYKILHQRPDRFCVKCNKKLRKFTRFEKCRTCRREERYKNDMEYRQKIRLKNMVYNKKETAREKKRLAVIRRRAKAKQLESTLNLKEWLEILEKYNHRCAYCGAGSKLEKDHVIPVSKGGPTTKENIVPACRSCNSKKKNKIGIFFPKIHTLA